jgi:hypothetical protein
LDNLCKQHDMCYAAKGYFACSCDNKLKQDVLMAIAKGVILNSRWKI